MAFRGRPAPGHEKGREEVAVGDALVSGTPVRIRGRDRCPGAPSPAPLQFRAGLRLCGEKSGSRRTGKGKSGGGVTDGADADLGKSRRRRRSSAPAPPNLPSPAPSESSSVPAPVSASSPGSPSLPLPALQQHRKGRFSGARGRSAKHEPAPEFSELPPKSRREAALLRLLASFFLFYSFSFLPLPPWPPRTRLPSALSLMRRRLGSPRWLLAPESCAQTQVRVAVSASGPTFQVATQIQRQPR